MHKIKTPVFVDTDGLIKDGDGELICEPNPDATYHLDNAIVEAINDHAALKARIAAMQDVIKLSKQAFQMIQSYSDGIATFEYKFAALQGETEDKA